MNKLKGSSEAVKMKYLLFVFAAAVLVVLPTRVYQLLALVDPVTGFYTSSDITITVLGAVLVIFVLLFMLLSFISKEVPSPKLPVGKNPVLGITGAVMAAALVYDIVSVERAIFPTRQNSVSIYISILKSNLAGSAGVFSILQMVFALFAVIYFAVFAISHLNGKASYREFKLLALTPLCWSMTKLVSRMMHAISFLSVSELLFEIFTLVFLMLFFLTFARISTGVFTQDSMWGIYGYGLSAALFTALITVPRLVVLAVGLEPVKGNEFDFTDLACLVFILSYIFASLGVGFKDGLKNRRTVTEVELPDEDEAVTKKKNSSTAGYFAAETEKPVVESAIEEEPDEEEIEFMPSFEEETAVEPSVTDEVFGDSEEKFEPEAEEAFGAPAEEVFEPEFEEAVEEPEQEIETDEPAELFVEDTQTADEADGEEAEIPDEVYENALEADEAAVEDFAVALDETDETEAAFAEDGESDEEYEESAETEAEDEESEDGEEYAEDEDDEPVKEKKARKSFKGMFFGKKKEKEYAKPEEEISSVSLAELKNRNK